MTINITPALFSSSGSANDPALEQQINPGDLSNSTNVLSPVVSFGPPIFPDYLAGATEFGEPTVLKENEVSPSSFSGATLFRDPVVLKENEVSPDFFGGATLFHDHAVTKENEIHPDHLASAATFYHAVVLGENEIYPGPLSNSTTFGVANVSSEMISPDHLTNDTTFGSHAVTKENEIHPGPLSNSTTFGDHTVQTAYSPVGPVAATWEFSVADFIPFYTFGIEAALAKVTLSGQCEFTTSSTTDDGDIFGGGDTFPAPESTYDPAEPPPVLHPVDPTPPPPEPPGSGDPFVPDHGFEVVDGGGSTFVPLLQTPTVLQPAFPLTGMAAVDAMNIRPMSNVSVMMPEAALVNGLPLVPKILGTTPVNLSVSGRRCSNPDACGIPGDAQYRWVSNNISSVDGTWMAVWHENNGGPSWQSVYPYRPRVVGRTEFLRDNSYRQYAKTAHFNHAITEHMWLDLGATTSALTVMVALVFTGFHGQRTQHVLDAGREPPAGMGEGANLNFSDGVGSHVAMHYGQRGFAISTARAQELRGRKAIRGRHNNTGKPKVVFSVFDGADSFGGWAMKKRVLMRKGRLNNRSTMRYLVLGRERNRLGRDHASDMAVFEVRIWDRALTPKQVRRNANRLSSKYKFNKYWN